MLVASLCHDVDHRGYNNAFFKKFNEPLATLYTNSVMEQHHYATTINLLQVKWSLTLFVDKLCLVILNVYITWLCKTIKYNLQICKIYI